MVQSNINHIEELISEIRPLITNDRIRELFTTKPKIEIDVYKKTAIFSALKEYEETYELSPAIPHAFYATLEHDLETIGFIKTVKKYEKEINLIVSLMKMDKKALLEILKILKAPNNINPSLQLEKRQELKEIIRRATSKFKESFVKERVDAKVALLLEHTTRTSAKQSEYVLDVSLFERIIMSNKDIKGSIKTIIQEKTGFKINDDQLTDLILQVLSKDYSTSYKNILHIEEPSSYKTFIDTRALTRLRKNYLAKLNKIWKDKPYEEKAKLVQLIEQKKTLLIRKQYSRNFLPLEEKSEFQDLFVESMSIETGKSEYEIRHILNKLVAELQSSTSKESMAIIEQIIGIMNETNIQLVLNYSGEFDFVLEDKLTEADRLRCKTYETDLKKLKSIHGIIFDVYKEQNKSILSLTKKSSGPLAINEDHYEIDTSYWLTKDKIMKAIEAIDQTTLDKISESNYELLKKFLLEDGLLWAYIADNIDLNTFSKIINNFDAIVASTPIANISISKLHEIIRLANMNDYTNDLIIGLVGQEIAAKVINYNQFSGVTVTDEIIHKRLRKLIDLSVRSEYISKSSLPFRCDVKLDGYQLQRWKNNDPTIFASGIDTKTCFFISVNENDFFFYSLLNKNGFVIKIVNEKGELVARASCFRKNNVFMINGIRCINNKVHPESREDTEEMKKIVDLIELFAIKLIERTSEDECPIDYVVCNKAGILENSFFENRFEQINADLFNEPINIYDDDWQEFVHLYDEGEQMLQEVPYSPNKSFTTDFGNHFPALLIRSRDYRPLFSPRDIAYNDQPATYERPKREIEEYIGLEITDEILARINRIKALSCFIGSEESQLRKQRSFKLLKKSEIKSIELGDDWYTLLKTDGSIEIVRAKNPSREIKNVAITKKTQV